MILVTIAAVVAWAAYVNRQATLRQHLMTATAVLAAMAWVAYWWGPSPEIILKAELAAVFGSLRGALAGAFPLPAARERRRIISLEMLAVARLTLCGECNRWFLLPAPSQAPGGPP